LIKFFPKDMQESEAYAILSQIRMIVAQKLARTIDGGKIAFRSWIVLDRETKQRLSKEDYSRWSEIVREIVKARGNDFDSAAYDAFARKVISAETFREISGMTPAEAREYVAQRGG
jgi:defect-in-organelle-trafficking protein DotB